MSGSKKKKFDTATMRRVIGLVTPERGYLAAGLVFAAVNVALTLTAPILIGLAVDRIVGPGEVDFAGMTPILAALAAVALGGALAGWLMTLCTNTVTYRAVRRLRQALFDKFGALPIAAIDRQARGDLVSRMTNDVEQLATGLLLNRLLGLQVWDYAGQPGNLLGQICPAYSLLWIPVSAAGAALDFFLTRRFLPPRRRGTVP